jgi:hypothetical protein
MGLAEVIALFTKLAELGISPPVQQALSGFLAKQMGVPQNVLDAAIAAAKDAPQPRQSDGT